MINNETWNTRMSRGSQNFVDSLEFPICQTPYNKIFQKLSQSSTLLFEEGNQVKTKRSTFLLYTIYNSLRIIRTNFLIETKLLYIGSRATNHLITALSIVRLRSISYCIHLQICIHFLFLSNPITFLESFFLQLFCIFLFFNEPSQL